MQHDVPVFLIVTPSFNSAGFIDETILGVVSQAGAFRIRYHVQDGGSADGTQAKLEQWASLLANGRFPVLCSGVEFTYRSEEDCGMYDAINRGFAYLNPSGAEYMTYINSDDRILPGALQFAASVFHDSPQIAWLGGRPCEMNERGELMRIHDEQVYPRSSLQAGLHDGRAMCFVMQEGTFWRAELWKKAGGFRTSLRQAGDWDLWRRFAEQAPYIATDTVLASHRRRGAQLTADMGVYYREVDEVVNQELAEIHQSELKRFQAWNRSSEEDRDRRFYAGILRFHVDTIHGGRGEWRVEERPFQAPLKTSVAVTNGFTRAMLPAEFESGFGPLGTAAHPLNLLSGYRASNSATCSFRFQAHGDGLHRIFLRCRISDSGVRLKLLNQTRTILSAAVPVTNHDRDCVLIAESVFVAGPNVISMIVSGRDPQEVPAIVVISCEAMSTV